MIAHDCHTSISRSPEMYASPLAKDFAQRAKHYEHESGLERGVTSTRGNKRERAKNLQLAIHYDTEAKMIEELHKIPLIGRLLARYVHWKEDLGESSS